MKKIAIIGKSSYIGESFKKYFLKKEPGSEIISIDTLDSGWKSFDFSGYDVAFIVAGIAHIKETKENSHLYYEINRDLATEAATLAKKSGVKQLIFLSTMSVYGKTTGHICHDTQPSPVNNYGKSKLQAENELKKMESEDFKVAIIRPPMVYGKNCKGNYNFLAKTAKKLPFFPEYKNERSMIYIDNLCEFLRQIIVRESFGVFMPQDNNYICTSDMVRLISHENEKKVLFTKFFNPFIKLFKVNVIKKVFGSLTYEKMDYGFDYNVVNDLSETISRIEGNSK